MASLSPPNNTRLCHCRLVPCKIVAPASATSKVVRNKVNYPLFRCQKTNHLFGFHPVAYLLPSLPLSAAVNGLRWLANASRLVKVENEPR